MFFLEWAVSDARTYREQSHDAHALLTRLLWKAGIGEISLGYTQEGRPFAVHRTDIDFSLAHTAGLVVCALETGTAAYPPRVGVDVEPIPASAEKALRLAERFFGESELRYIQNATDPCLAFAEVFTAKEAYSKYLGDGLSRHLKNTDTKTPGFACKAGVSFTRYLPEGFCITLCQKQKSCPE